MSVLLLGDKGEADRQPQSRDRLGLTTAPRYEHAVPSFIPSCNWKQVAISMIQRFPETILYLSPVHVHSAGNPL
ncbi:MAG: hypothetical protein ACI8PG_003156 [Planctomycetota bacterium]|jgi:hypothetical protein